MRRWKQMVNQWILDDLIEEAIIVSLKILVKLIEKKFFRFVKDNNIIFYSKEEELELKKYFEKEYKRNYLKKHN